MKTSLWRLSDFLNLVVKSNCPLCDRPADQAFCSGCQRQVQQCQLVQPLQHEPPLPPILAYGYYRGALKQTIAALKYNHNPHLAKPLGLWMAQTWLASQACQMAIAPIVIPVPMHPDKQKQRGFNQAELLAESFCAFARLPLERHGLARSRETIAQFQLSPAVREQNLAEAFRLGDRWLKEPPARPILLLDDIYTTGATARSTIQTLRRHGIRVSGLVVLARATMAIEPQHS